MSHLASFKELSWSKQIPRKKKSIIPHLWPPHHNTKRKFILANKYLNSSGATILKASILRSDVSLSTRHHYLNILNTTCNIDWRALTSHSSTLYQELILKNKEKFCINIINYAIFLTRKCLNFRIGKYILSFPFFNN